MAELHAGVGAGVPLAAAAHLPAGVRHQALVPVPLRVPQLPAEAAVLGGGRRGDGLAARAPPTPGLRAGGLSPLLYTDKMEYLNIKV